MDRRLIGPKSLVSISQKRALHGDGARPACLRELIESAGAHNDFFDIAPPPFFHGLHLEPRSAIVGRNHGNSSCRAHALNSKRSSTVSSRLMRNSVPKRVAANIRSRRLSGARNISATATASFTP